MVPTAPVGWSTSQQQRSSSATAAAHTVPPIGPAACLIRHRIRESRPRAMRAGTCHGAVNVTACGLSKSSRALAARCTSRYLHSSVLRREYVLVARHARTSTGTARAMTRAPPSRGMSIFVAPRRRASQPGANPAKSNPLGSLQKMSTRGRRGGRARVGRCIINTRTGGG